VKFQIQTIYLLAQVILLMVPAAALAQDGLLKGQPSAARTADVQMSSASVAEASQPQASNEANLAVSAPSASSPKPIQGGVEHSEVLPELIGELHPGKVYCDDLLMKAGTAGNDMWFHIPSWYAGARHSERMTVVYRYNYKTGETTQPMFSQLERQDSISGYQKDKNGGIWDYRQVPRIQHVESDFVDAVLFVKSIHPVKDTAEQFVIEYEEISITLQKGSHKILQVTQQEQISTVSSPEPGLLRSDVSVKNFDMDGKPLRKEQSLVFSKIQKPFEQIDSLKGVDLKASFVDYLHANHLDELVPTAAGGGLANDSVKN
jgi:hypothetical protein